MHHFYKSCTALALGLFAISAIAAPLKLITNNLTDVESNAFIGGTIPSQHPTKAHSRGEVAWGAVKLACFGHTDGDRCSALVKMASDTANPVVLGLLVLDLKTGNITPGKLEANGYTLTVTGPGQTTITQN